MKSMLYYILSSISSEDVTEAVEETTEKAHYIKDYIDALLPNLLAFGIKVLVAIICFVIGSRIINFIRGRFRKNFAKSDMEEGVAQFLDSVIKVCLYFLLIVFIGTQFGITTASVVALLGSSGLTLGLALQGSLSNFAGGVLILIQKPFVVGDYIREDTHGNEGVVKNISMIYTTIRTNDGCSVVIPNGTLANASIRNYNYQNECRLDVKVGISYESDLPKAKELLRTLGEGSDYRMGDSQVSVFVDGLGDSSVDLTLRLWVDLDHYLDAKRALLEAVKLTFDVNDIDIPYPQVTISQKN